MPGRGSDLSRLYEERRQLMEWLNESVRELNVRERFEGGFTRLSVEGQPYFIRESSRTLRVTSDSGLIRVSLVVLGYRHTGIEAIIRTAQENKLIDIAQLLPSRTNNRELWCDLKHSDKDEWVMLSFELG